MMDSAASRHSMSASGGRIPLGVCVGYGVGSIGAVMMANVVATFFPPFMATVLGQSTAIAGLLLTFSKLYDAVADIAIGRMSDLTHTRWGRRRPFMLAGAVLAALSIVLVFVPSGAGATQLIIYLAFSLILYSTGYSLFAVPYTAMSGEMTDDYRERTRLQSFRVFFMSAGQIASVAGAAAVIGWLGANRRGYAAMGIMVASIIAATMLACVLGTSRAARATPRSSERFPSLAASLRAVFNSRPLKYLLMAKLFQYISVSVFFSVILLFLLNVAHAGYNALVVYSSANTLGIACSTYLWVRAGRRFGKRRCYLFAIVLLMAHYASWAIMPFHPSTAALAARGFVSGAAVTGMVIFSLSMLTDTMAYDSARHNGARREGMIAGFFSVVEKVGFATGPTLSGAGLAICRYRPTHEGQLIAQPPSAISALYVLTCAIPGILLLVSGVMIWRYDLDEAQLNATAAAPDSDSRVFS